MRSSEKEFKEQNGLDDYVAWKCGCSRCVPVLTTQYVRDAVDIIQAVGPCNDCCHFESVRILAELRALGA